MLGKRPLEQSMKRFRILAGLVITVVGAVWLVSRLGGIDRVPSTLGDWWPIAVVALGMVNLLALVRRPTWLLAPIILVAGGVLGLLATQDHKLPTEAQPYVWPATVTVVGIVIALWERTRIENADEYLRQTVVLRSRTLRSTTGRFQHGTVRAILGNLELDLQHCQLLQRAELCVTTVFGHVDVLPPPDCQVRLKGRRFGPGVVVPALPALDPKQPRDLATLEVSVMGLMGGFDLRPVWHRDAAAIVAGDGANREATPAAVSALFAGRRS
jgi:hypothetical protein